MSSFRGVLRLVAIGSVLVLVAVTCTGGGSTTNSVSASGESSGSSGTDCGTLQMAFNFDMQTPDPDIFYQADGLNVTQGAYDGLLRYVPNSQPPTIGPDLASSWSISPDGLTYTFHLRKGVKFTDGTDFNSKAMVYDFQRRLDVNAGPAYYTSYIDSTETPDPYTLIVHLKAPNNGWIGMVASPYGFKAISPTAIKKHTVNGDFAQKWLATHSEGTGPYYYSHFSAGDYELTRNDNYWGTAPDFTPACFQKVHIGIIPDFTTQQLELENGQLDLLIHGVGKNDLPRFQDENFSIFRTFGIDFVVMHLNTDSGPFSDPAVRAAVPEALDRQTIVDQVWGGDSAEVAHQIWPKGTIPADIGTYDVTSDPSKLAAAVKAGGWSNTTVDLAYTTDDPVNQQLAGLMAAQLTQAGLKTNTVGVTQPQTFTYADKPEIRPDALVLPATPDAINAWSWSFCFYNVGCLSYFQPKVCQSAYNLTVKGAAVVDETGANEVYAQAAQAYQDCGAYVPIADVAETIVGAPGMTGFEHEPDSLWALRLASLHWANGASGSS